MIRHSSMRDLLFRKMASYIRYLNGLVDEGQIDGPIHLIRSSQTWASPEQWDGWEQRSHSGLTVVQGFGEHAHLTDNHHVGKNAAIINNCLASSRHHESLNRLNETHVK